jgi:DNA-binding response OmpR family regulator
VACLVFDALPADETASAPSPALKVLVVEDAEVYGMLLVQAFRQRGHQAHEVSTLQAARSALAGGGYDLVLSDVNLPDGDAAQLVHWLGGDAVAPRPRVAVMTADRHSAPASLAALLQGQPLLEKTDDVRALVERALRPAGPLAPSAA